MLQDRQPAPVMPGESGLQRFRATVAYDGTGYHGWAAQPGILTVEAALGRALGQVLRRGDIALTCGGRTDAGVHAAGQVVHFEALGSTDPRRLRNSCNAVLPGDIRVLDVASAPPGFDARFSALWRQYRYRVTEGVPDPLMRHMVLAVRRPLDVSAMQQAVAGLLGLHDYGSFCKSRPPATTVRNLLSCNWHRDPQGLVVLEIKADAFCHGMVRSIVGASLEVGSGRRPEAWLATLLAAPSRRSAPPVAPARGLVLEAIGYPDPAHYAQRASQARQVRRLPE